MRSHYVVEVLDDPQNTAEESAPLVSSAADTSSLSSNQGAGRRQRVEVVTESEKPNLPNNKQDIQTAPQQETVPAVTQVQERTVHIHTSGRVTVDHKALHAKLNRTDLSPSLPQQQEQSQTPQRDQSPPQDMFESSQHNIQKAWQQVALEGAQEEPTVHLPVAATQMRVSPEVIQPSIKSAERLQRIERLFAGQSGSIASAGARDYVPGKSETVITRSKLPGKRLSRRRRRGVAVLMAVLFLSLGSLAALGTVVWSDLRGIQNIVRQLPETLQTGSMASAQEQVQLLERKTKRLERLYGIARPVARPVLGAEKAQHLDELFVVAEKGSVVASEAFAAYTTASLGYEQFIARTPGNTLDTTASLSGQLEVLYTNLSEFQAEVSGLSNPFNSALITQLKQETSSTVPELRRSILATQQVVAVLPSLLGGTGDAAAKKQYLVLLQNNAELRPTGGFIGSIGVLTVQGGKFVDFRVEDVYEADGQLNGFVEPPAELKQYLGEAQWYLRDVNWSPDFPTVAEQASWFADKTLGIQPDGVIAVNLSVAQHILAATGPLTLPDYNEVITQENIYERAQLHSELNFFPGSTQKRDFLSALASALFQKLTSGSADTTVQAAGPKLLPALYSSAQESQVLLSFKDLEAARVFRGLGWDGSLLSPECPPPFSTGTCATDTVMQVEANVGVNKANQYLTRTVQHDVTIGNEAVAHSRTITFTNTSQSNAWPQGAYKTYLRLFVSPNASFTSVSIDGQIVPFELVTQTMENGKAVFGVLVNVPVQSTVNVELAYQVPLPSGWNSYALFEQKQSGTGTGFGAGNRDTLTHSLEVLGDKRVVTIAPQPEEEVSSVESALGSSTQQRFVFTSDRREHDFMAIEVAR